MFNVLKDNNISLLWSYENKNFYPLGSTSGIYEGEMPWNGSVNVASNKSFVINLDSYKHSSCLISTFYESIDDVVLDYQISIGNFVMDENPYSATPVSVLYREGIYYVPFRINSITVNIQEVQDTYVSGSTATYDLTWSVLLL